MAPGDINSLNEVDDKLKAVIQNFYNLIVETVEHQGPRTEDAMKNDVRSLVSNLADFSRSASKVPISIPFPIISYIDEGRNPDIYTREFIEKVQILNQQNKGKAEAFAQFRDILGKELMTAMPDLKQDVKKVLEATGGKLDG